MTYPRIVGYTYCADIYCPDCVLDAMNVNRNMFPMKTETVLTMLAIRTGIDRFYQSSYDSDDFPKVIFSTQLEHREHCARCSERIK